MLLDLLLKGGDLPGKSLHVGLELGQVGRLGLDRLEGQKDVLLQLGLGGVVMGNLILEGLVLFVLLDLVELGLQVIDLGLNALERVFVFLEMHLGILERLAGGFQFGLACREGQPAGGQGLGTGAQTIAQRSCTLM